MLLLVSVVVENLVGLVTIVVDDNVVVVVVVVLLSLFFFFVTCLYVSLWVPVILLSVHTGCTGYFWQHLSSSRPLCSI